MCVQKSVCVSVDGACVVVVFVYLHVNRDKEREPSTNKQYRVAKTFYSFIYYSLKTIQCFNSVQFIRHI